MHQILRAQKKINIGLPIEGTQQEPLCQDFRPKWENRPAHTMFFVNTYNNVFLSFFAILMPSIILLIQFILYKTYNIVCCVNI